MRIAIVLGPLNFSCGPSVNTVRLARGLKALGHSVLLLHQTPPEEMDCSLSAELQGLALPLPRCHPLHPALPLCFGRLLRRHRPDIVHFNLPTHLLLLASVTKRLAIPAIYTMGNLLEYNAGWIRRWMQYTGPRQIEAFVGVGQAVADNIREHSLSRAEPSVVYNGVERPEADRRRSDRAAIRTRFAVQPTDILVGTAGRLVADKAQIHLLEALSVLRSEHRNVRFMVVGDGPMRAMMEGFCHKASLDGVVIFAGRQRGIAPFLAAMDIFAFHSLPYSEGLPTVVPEAAMMGLPLVLANIDCLREVFHPDVQALFAEPGDAAGFAAMISSLIVDTARREQLAEASRDHVQSLFSVTAMTNAYLEIYRACLH